MDFLTQLEAAKQFATPLYIFDTDELKRRCESVKKAFGENVGLCFSIKANPFITASVPDCISNLEVCSPGELSICEKSKIDMKKVIFSGVNKEYDDVLRAISDGVGVLTAESAKHVRLIEECAEKLDLNVSVLLRVSSGNQFGMDEDAVKEIIKDREKLSKLHICGLHYFSGTMKKKAVNIEKELSYICGFADSLFDLYGFKVEKLEYGAGLAADYFGESPESTDAALLESVSEHIRAAGNRYSLTVEMGRFFAATSGTYLTKVVDVKRNFDINYAVCDGGIHQLHYDGQIQGMQIPKLENINAAGDNKDYWTLCGSLCTAADVLARKALVRSLEEGSIISFSRVGAYSVNEGIAMLLSRKMPRVTLYSEKNGFNLVRDFIETFNMNTPIEKGDNC